MAIALMLSGPSGRMIHGDEPTGFAMHSEPIGLDVPRPSEEFPIQATADEAMRWQDGPDQVWILRGNCQIRQGDVEARCKEAVIWTRPALLGTQTHHVTCYLETDVNVTLLHKDQEKTGFSGRQAQVSSRWRMEHWRTQFPPQFQVRTVIPASATKPTIWDRARQYRSREAAQVQTVQFESPLASPSVSATGVAPGAVPPGVKLRIVARGTSARNFRYPSPDGRESIVVLDGGVRAEITDEQTGDLVQISADRIVGWGETAGNLGAESANGPAPREIYLEGNVDYRHGQTIVQAERMFYNVAGEYGVVLRAEFVSPLSQIPQFGPFQGYARLKADVLQQIDSNRFVAQGASFTTSRMGIPSYWVQAEQMALTRIPQTPIESVLSPDPLADPASNPAFNTIVQSRNNFVYWGGVPVFYWPRFTSDLNRPTTYLESIGFNNDRVFGIQFMTTWDLYQVFGVDKPPPNTDWNLSVDYLSERGVGVGTDYSYGGQHIANLPGTATGYWDLWGINDHGLDNLGADRRAVPPEKDFRGRLFGRHRHIFEPGLWLDAEVGLISDRNFLEQYFETEWDQQKDQTTGLELRKLIEERSWSLSTNARVNDFVTNTDWLPRLDHFTLGRSFLGNRLTWFEHSHVGYANMKVATAPTNPFDAATYDPLPWEVPSQGVRAATRQEIDLPFSLGPVKFVPYALGEVGYWQQDLSGNDLSRAYGQVGIRNSLPLWKLNQDVRSILFNLNGLAHKVVLHTDAYLADANRNFDQFPLYDPLDDDSVEFFRRRMEFTTYGGTFGQNAPAIYDERNFAFRRGIQSSVTGPTEIVDDQMAVRMGTLHRWQTKRGRVGEERIIDWITFNLEGTYFPKPDRDNFGESFGVLDYDFRWHVGDRVTMVSDGYMDLFDEGLKMVTVGAFLTRPGQSQFFGGFRNIDGPFQSHLVTGSAQYRLSDKWVMSYGSSIDLGPTGNIGQAAYITRVGESFLTTVGFTVDSSRGNVGFRFSIWPRILASRSPYGGVAGVPIPPVGLEGLE